MLPPRQAALLLSFLRFRKSERAARARRELACKQRRRQWRKMLSALAAALERRMIERAVEGWSGSTLAGYLDHGDAITYRQKFRVTRGTLQHITDKLSAGGYVVDSRCRNHNLRVTAIFKNAVCLYFLAHGCGDVNVVADVASIGESSVRRYLKCMKPLGTSEEICRPWTRPG